MPTRKHQLLREDDQDENENGQEAEGEEDESNGEELGDEEEDGEEGADEEEDEEEEEEMGDGEEEEGGDEDGPEKPMSHDADPEELYQGAMIMVKHVMAQTHNEHSNDRALISHQDIDDTLVDQHEDDDWRVQILRSEDENGNPFHLEAKMDTGADKNLISLDAADGHGLLVEQIEGPKPAFTVGSGETAGLDGIVRWKYSAGDPSQTYTEDLYAKAGLPHDVILGMPFLMHSHAITLNPQFAHKQENDDFLLFETQPATKDSKAKRAAFAKQQREEREAAFYARTSTQKAK